MLTYLDALQSTKTGGPAFSQRQLVTTLKRCSRPVLHILMEHRRAKAAEEVYSRLSAMSDESLAGVGIKRAEIASEVKRRLYED